MTLEEYKNLKVGDYVRVLDNAFGCVKAYKDSTVKVTRVIKSKDDRVCVYVGLIGYIAVRTEIEHADDYILKQLWS